MDFNHITSMTEAIKGALPIAANSPQRPPYGLYAEKLSGIAFTAPQNENLQTSLYRVIPAAAHTDFSPAEELQAILSLDDSSGQMHQVPNQLRWVPFDIDPNVDWTELGHIHARPNEIVVIPRGIRYRVTLPEGPVRGYILELYQGHFQLPELGPIGSNGLANARDFQVPIAAYKHDTKNEWNLFAKFDGKLFKATQDHTPFDVVAWHGLYYPYKYNLGRYNVIGSTSFDHPDPSIYTVLTAPSDHVGTAVADFVIFPPRWLVQENTFRPPWYHRNTMSEFMGLIHGEYDAKSGGGFQPAGASLHNVMSAHGPDAGTHEKASAAELGPQKIGTGSMAFMFESCLMLGVTNWA
ncbi:hypothetical protein VE02_09990 [Pseudogymnoascus sp. 03VT05]|nr:hypothetical protein VE02_09990 [Pseudogymnoascus sp. 03VT05]